MDKYIDNSIIIDEINLPKMLLDYIEQLKKYAKEDNDIKYILTFEDFESAIKGFVLNNKLTKADYDALIKKYGGVN